MSTMFKIVRSLGAFVASIPLVTGTVLAQTVPPRVAPQIDPGLINKQNQRNQLQLEQQTAPVLQGPAVVVPKNNPAAIVAPGGATFVLKAVIFDGSKFLGPEELEAVAARYRGRRIDISQVQRLVKEVNDLYAAKGVATAAAYLPPQDLKNGVLHVALVEGRLGSIGVKGNRALSSDYLLSRIPHTAGEVVDVEQLTNSVAGFNKTGVAQVQAFLQPGAQFGLTDIQLAVLEPPTNALQLFVDNQGVESVGRLEGGFLYQRYAPLGIDDRLTLYLVKSDGNISGNAGYNVPFDAAGGRVGASFTRGHTHIVEGPFKQLDIDGDSETGSFNVSHPIFTDQNWLFLALGSFSYTRSQSQQTKIPINDNETFKESGGFTLAYTAPTFGASVTPIYSHGHAEFNLVDRKSDFDLATGTYAASYRLPYDFLATTAGAFQVSSTELIPGDSLFEIGGPTTVRGFPTDAIAAATGYYNNLELHRGLVDLSPTLEGIDGFAFYDRGEVYSDGFKPVALNSAGLGFTYDIRKVVLAEVSAGFPLNKAVDRQSDYELYFRLTFKLEP